MPSWYVNWCDRMTRAVWIGQVTEREATVALQVMHACAIKEAWELA
jgi:hypothetical protein